MQKGFISLFALCCLLFLEGILLTAAVFYRGNIMQTNMNSDSIKAYYLAESGLNMAVDRLTQTDFAVLTLRVNFSQEPDIVYENGINESLRVYIKGNIDGREVLAVGTVGEMSREVYAILKYDLAAERFAVEKIKK